MPASIESLAKQIVDWKTLVETSSGTPILNTPRHNPAPAPQCCLSRCNAASAIRRCLSRYNVACRATTLPQRYNAASPATTLHSLTAKRSNTSPRIEPAIPTASSIQPSCRRLPLTTLPQRQSPQTPRPVCRSKSLERSSFRDN